MSETSLSLLNRLAEGSDADSWTRLTELYTPLLRHWLGRYDIQESDADDLVQEVLLAVSKEVRGFKHSERSGAFRSWLRTILIHRLHYFWRSRGRRAQATGDSRVHRLLNELADPTSQISTVWNRQHDEHVVKQILAEARPHFETKTWQAFLRVALEGKKADVVAADLNMSLNAVFIAKSRVLHRLRQLSEGLVGGSSDYLPNS